MRETNIVSSEVKSICILGGGTSGFSVASVLAKYSKSLNLNLDITVVYSSSIGNIGVGESTILSINELFQYLGLRDQDWMKNCNATYKTSIAFENFYKKGESFQYPFGVVTVENDEYGKKWFQLKEHFPKIFTQDTFAKYIMPHTRLAEKNKLCDISETLGFHIDYHSAYHFDTNLLANFLKQYCFERGVKFIDDKYINSNLNSNGYIESIECEQNTINADLFIDCSGFKSLLLEDVMKAEFVNYNDTLINNRVVRAKVPYTNKEEQLKNYTNCVALNNGWCWEIPLWDSLSLGYVHSLKFTSEDEVIQEFKDHCATKNVLVSDEDISIVNYKTGRHKQGWIKNVVGVGLSYGFLEPLESTGISTLLTNTFRLLECLSKRKLYYTDVDRNIFNNSVGSEIDGLRGFIELHYALSSRNDSEYWRYVTQEVEYPMDEKSAYYMMMHSTTTTRNYVNNYSLNNGHAFILGGMNYSHYSPAFLLAGGASEDLEERKNRYLKEDEIFSDVVDSYRSSYKYLKDKIYGW